MNLDTRQDQRISEILDLIIQITSGNLSARGNPSERGDELDAIIVGLNMLGEELSASFEAVRKARDELEERVQERTLELTAANQAFQAEIVERHRVAQTLREAEARYRALVESSPAVTYLAALDEIGSVLYVSPQIEAMLGFAPAEWQAAPALWSKQLHPADRERALAEYSRAGETGEPFHSEYRLLRRDGRVVWVQDTAGMVHDEAGQVHFMHGLMIDITDRKQAEQEEREQRAFAEALSHIAATLNSTLDLNEVLDHILANVGRVVEHDAANIMLVDAERGTARVVHGRGYAERGLESAVLALRFNVADVANLRQMAETGRPCLVPDVQVYPGWVDLAETRWLHSFVGAPIRVKGQVVGFLNLDSATPGFFSRTHAERLQAFADQAAIAVENARLFEDVRRSAENLAALHATLVGITSQMESSTLLQTIVERATQLLAGASGGLYLCDPDNQQARCVVSYNTLHDYTGVVLKYGEGAAGTVALTGKPLILDDYRTWPGRAAVYEEERPFTALISAPMIWQDQVIGVIHVMHNVEHWRFTERDLELLTLFAGQAAIAVHNARLYDTIRAYSEELEQRVAKRTAELERERNQMRTILDTAGEGIVVTDPNWAIVYANQAAERITGYAFAEMQGQNPRLLKSGLTLADVFEDVGRTLARGEVWRGEVINRRKDGAPYNAALTVSPLKSADDVIIGYVSVQRDITRDKELDRLKIQLVSRVGHELRTPVTNVHLYVELLERGNPRKREQYLKTLHQETERLRRLVEGYLELSQLDADEVAIRLAPVDLNQLAADLVSGQQPQAAKRDLSLDYHPAPDLPAALADADLLARAMSILLENALNYTSPVGSVTCTTGVRASGDQEWVTFAVQDTGPGITPEEMPRLFERFYRGAAARDYTVPGAGLGLAIGKAIADKLGGRITAESQPGRGATFTLWLKPAPEDTPE